MLEREELLSGVFHSRETEVVFKADAVEQEKRPHTDLRLPLVVHDHMHVNGLHTITPQKRAFSGACSQPFLRRMTEMNDTLFLTYLASTAKLSVSCGQRQSSAEANII